MAAFISFLVAAFAAVVAGVGVMMVTVAAMWGLNKTFDDRLGDTSYGDFDFDDFEQPDLMKFAQRAAVVFVVPTALALITLYLLKSNFIISRANSSMSWLLFLVHFGLVFLLVQMLFATEKPKGLIIAAVATLTYMFIYGVIIPTNMTF